MSLLGNWFDDLGRSLLEAVGNTWLLIIDVLLAAIAIVMIFYLVSSSLKKGKIVFRWGLSIIFVIIILLVVWFTILLT